VTHRPEGPEDVGIHPIELESYAILERRVDLSGWRDGARQIVARMIHATADESFARSARIGDHAVEAAVAGILSGAPVVCDARMVVAGIPSVTRTCEVLCYLDSARSTAAETTAEAHAAPPPSTRSAAAIDAAAADHPTEAIWVIGNAPTALERLLVLYRLGRVVPLAVVGLPVGYVGAAEAKRALWRSDLRPISITNTGRRGGSPVAAGAVNALARLALAADGKEKEGTRFSQPSPL
jgi:precorrin-8X/cobalt-precorrin-8 methylmutase